MRKLVTFIALVFAVAAPFLIEGKALAADRDFDTVDDAVDNCPFTANFIQEDTDHNGVGNVCENDFDNDGVANANDNCFNLPNTDQADLDGDKVGDLCDIDRDGDGLTNTFEIKIGTNPDNWDSDNDKISDLTDCVSSDPTKGTASDCSTVQIVKPPVDPSPLPSESPFGDNDNDGIINANDNCPNNFNPGQQDADADGLGDACDNQFHINADLLFLKGGGDVSSSCSLISAATTPTSGASIFLLLGLPGIVLGLFKKSR